MKQHENKLTPGSNKGSEVDQFLIRIHDPKERSIYSSLLLYKNSNANQCLGLHY
ncbi:hypothetical protein VQL36_13240 [Chengkuizengella sp. SCS-71B]|uniref:hypothetical protein n=1 Tax=Chengkuizengella sp. SCS-71B TaxID=3115290 RepID=UPI0032C21057